MPPPPVDGGPTGTGVGDEVGEPITGAVVGAVTEGDAHGDADGEAHGDADGEADGLGEGLGEGLAGVVLEPGPTAVATLPLGDAEVLADVVAPPAAAQAVVAARTVRAPQPIAASLARPPGAR